MQRGDDILAVALQTGAQKLHDEPFVVAIADERRQPVAFAVNQAVCGGVRSERVAAAHGVFDTVVPPRGVDSRVAGRGR